ncbi:MAG: molecular chaperone SurA, partial [Gammaproteobacteria bacterium]|nr:molecular chaperone SurA [Gammaproteobacteria bacterium]
DILEKQVLERLIFQKLQLQKARQMGIRISDDTLNEAVRRVATRNGLSILEFKDVMEADGYDFSAFREGIRDELTLDRLRKRQVTNRIMVTEREVENLISTLARQGGMEEEFRLGHILVTVQEAASPEDIKASSDKVEEIRKQHEEGEDFTKLAISMSDGRRALEGGDLGWRKVSQLPSLFADVVPEMKPGDISEALRSSSGFHIVKLFEVRQGERQIVRQTHARHILIRTDEMTSDEDAKIRLEQLRQRIEGGDKFEELARSHSVDSGSAVNGGDLGWVNPGDVVPSFENMMNQLKPGEISVPFKSAFGWHLMQVIERREHDSTEDVRRAKAKEIIRRRKIDEELQAWLRRLRDEAYVEYRLDDY